MENDCLCEMLNADYGKMPDSRTIDGVSQKSALLALMKQSKNFCQWLSGCGIDKTMPTKAAPIILDNEIDDDDE